jgi:hypothetical protein
MGLNEGSNRIYVNFSYGMVRKKCDPSHPKAVPRELKDRTVIHEQVWRSLTGILEDVLFKTHDEYGNSWNINLKDDNEEFSAQVQENSRYGADFLRKLPNLRHGQIYTFLPYDFEHNGKRNVGLSITDQEGNKIPSYYQEFSEDKNVPPKNLHGFPTYDGDWSDKDETKIYFTRVTKFLRLEAQKYLEKDFRTAPPVSIEDEDRMPF